MLEVQMVCSAGVLVQRGWSCLYCLGLIILCCRSSLPNHVTLPTFLGSLLFHCSSFPVVVSSAPRLAPLYACHCPPSYVCVVCCHHHNDFGCILGHLLSCSWVIEPQSITRKLHTSQCNIQYNYWRGISYITPWETFLFCLGSGDGGRTMSCILFVDLRLCGVSVGRVFDMLVL